jgi:hypothetical protein
VRDGTASEAHAEGAAPCALFDGDALAASMEEVGVGIQRASLPLAVLDVELLDSLGGGSPRSATKSSSRSGSTNGVDENDESEGSKRRRSRRRGRRRGGRDEAGEEGGPVESVEASEVLGTTEGDDSEPPKVETSSESTGDSAGESTQESGGEPSEDTEKKPAEPPPAPDAEAEQL